MNRTEKARLDMARKMLKGQIDAEEVAMISGVPLTQVQKMRKEMDDHERQMLGGVTVREMEMENIMIDNEILDEREVETDQYAKEDP